MIVGLFIQFSGNAWALGQFRNNILKPSVPDLEVQNMDEFDVWLRFSWSSTVIQDTLKVSESFWTHCYLWSDFPDWNEDFMGFSGFLVQSNGIQIHEGRFLLPGDVAPFSLDPEIPVQGVSVFTGQCDNVKGAVALFEFDVFIDVSLMDSSDGSSSIIFFPSPPLGPPLVFLLLSDDCWSLFLEFPADMTGIWAKFNPVPTQQSLFGSIKAMFR
jgi:hypothetical protein